MIKIYGAQTLFAKCWEETKRFEWTFYADTNISSNVVRGFYRDWTLIYHHKYEVT